MEEVDKLLEDIQIEIEMDWIVLDWWRVVNRIAKEVKTVEER